jgi:hypothetical protein
MSEELDFTYGINNRSFGVMNDLLRERVDKNGGR